MIPKWFESCKQKSFGLTWRCSSPSFFKILTQGLTLQASLCKNIEKKCYFTFYTSVFKKMFQKKWKEEEALPKSPKIKIFESVFFILLIKALLFFSRRWWHLPF